MLELDLEAEYDCGEKSDRLRYVLDRSHVYRPGTRSSRSKLTDPRAIVGAGLRMAVIISFYTFSKYSLVLTGEFIMTCSDPTTQTYIFGLYAAGLYSDALGEPATFHCDENLTNMLVQ